MTIETTKAEPVWHGKYHEDGTWKEMPSVSPCSFWTPESSRQSMRFGPDGHLSCAGRAVYNALVLIAR